MSVTVTDYIESLDLAIKGLNKATYDAVAKTSTQDTLTDLTMRRLQDGRASDGGELINSNNRYRGTYSGATDQLYESGVTSPLLPKEAGSLYNFVDTGDFRKGIGFEVYFNEKDNAKLEAYSEGIGAGDKADFFNGYGDQLFGFPDDQMEVINKIIFDHLCDYLNEKL